MTKEELARLETILQSFPTTEAEDAQLLEGKSILRKMLAQKANSKHQLGFALSARAAFELVVALMV